MMETVIYTRNWLSRLLYKAILRPIFFRIDPETTHNWFLSIGTFLGSSALTRAITRLFFAYSNKSLEQNIFGTHFSNPIGLAAGFDKDAVLTDILPSVGFGFAEVGSITGEPCAGNPKPRLWRLVASKGLVVHTGLKNEGCERVSNRLRGRRFAIPIGTNIAKTNSRKTVETEAGINDYVKAFGQFTGIGSYFAINISCPNAFGGQPFTDAKRLDQLLSRIAKIATKKPVFLKISPDLTKREVDQIIDVARGYRIAGFICTNLTEQRKNEKIVEKSVPENGGVSGKPVEVLANDLISHVYRKTKGEFIIIGCGGVFSAVDAYKKIKLGANLVELLTGMIYEGPQVISEINQGLACLLKRDGFKNISQAVGVDNRF